MNEQAPLIVSIITALFTGGIVIFFLENQHVGANIAERYQFIMKPFMHKLSSYFKFLSISETYFYIKNNVNKKDAEHAYALYNLIKKLSHHAFSCIMTGQDYPTSHFSAKQLENICDDINRIWYYWDNKQSYIKPYSEYDSNKANMFYQLNQEYLNEVFPNEYKKSSLSMDLISDVSGRFYTNIYLPIQKIPFHYEIWCKEEHKLKTITLHAIGLCILLLALVLFLRYIIPLWFINILSLLTILTFVYVIYKFSKIESLSRKLFN